MYLLPSVPSTTPHKIPQLKLLRDGVQSPNRKQNSHRAPSGVPYPEATEPAVPADTTDLTATPLTHTYTPHTCSDTCPSYDMTHLGTRREGGEVK